MFSLVGGGGLTTQQLDPALHRLRRLSVLDVLQGLVQEDVACRSVGLADHLRRRTDHHFLVTSTRALECFGIKTFLPTSLDERAET